MSDRLICDSHVKHFIKEKVKRLRPGWGMTQVSEDALNLVEAKLRAWLIDAVKRHPTRGKTFTEII